MAVDAMGLTPMSPVMSEEGTVESRRLRGAARGLDKVRGRSGFEVLPDNVGGLGNAATGAVVHENGLRTAARDDITGGLEDEKIACGALEVEVGAEVDVGAPIAHARREIRPGDEGEGREEGWREGEGTGTAWPQVGAGVWR